MNLTTALLLLLAPVTPVAAAYSNPFANGGCNGNCEKDPTACKATVWGDPHIITFDKLKYEAQARGEVTLLKSLDSDLEIQARFEATNVAAAGNPSVTTGVVVKHHNPALDKVQVDFACNPGEELVELAGCPVRLFYTDSNGQTTLATKLMRNGPGDVNIKKTSDTMLKVSMGDDMDVRIAVTKWSGTCILHAKVKLRAGLCDENIVGILGSPDDDKDNDWINADYSLATVPGKNSGGREYEAAYNHVTSNWCLRSESDSLFHHPDACTAFDSVNHCDDPYDDGLETLIEELENNDPDGILDICKEAKNEHACLIDGAVLGTEAASSGISIETSNFESEAETTSGPTAGPSSAPSSAPTFESEETTSGPTAGPSSAPSSAPTLAPVTRTESGANGDPHFKTWKNEHFEYHGQCDLTLVKDESFADGLGINVQIRTKLVRFWSYIQSVAIRIGDDILEVQGLGAPEPNLEKTNYWFNLERQGELKTIGGFPVTLKARSQVKRHFEIDLSSKYPGQKIVVDTFREFIKVDFQMATQESFGNSVGLLGDFKTGETRARDGATVLHDFSAFGSEWQVLPYEHMLFHDVADPQFPKKCIEPEDPRGQRRRRLEEENVSEEQAELACASLKDPLDRKDCIYDILATQDIGMVGAY